jgi:integrase/recombinase XerD
VAYLRDVGLVPAPEPTALTDPVELLVAEFVGYLMRERGLRDGSHTVWEYRRTARLFLTGRLDPDGGGLERVTAGEVTGFVLRECLAPQPQDERGAGEHAEGLLRFLFLEGLLSADLTGAVPKVASWRCASSPKALPSEHVARLLASCDRMTAVGRRDFAILLMRSRLGLRACEVAKLRLADIDWRAGELIVRGKRDRHERLPLPADVGEALVDYLRHGRPSCEDPHVFVKARAPFRGLTGGAGAIGMLVREACERAGLEPVGVHSLRHTVATNALRAGAPLEEIASLLEGKSLPGRDCRWGSGGLRQRFESDLVTEALELGDEPSGLSFWVAFAEVVATEVAVQLAG